VKQAYKQTKHALSWSQYQVHDDVAMRRHWQLVCCAFSFCWRRQSRDAGSDAPQAIDEAEQPVADAATGRGENTPPASAGVLAGGTARRARLAGTMGTAPALLAGVVVAPPAARPVRPTRVPAPRPRA